MEHRIGGFRSEYKPECSLAVCCGYLFPHSCSWNREIGAVDLSHPSKGLMGCEVHGLRKLLVYFTRLLSKVSQFWHHRHFGPDNL